jgi:hypothetical protein
LKPNARPESNQRTWFRKVLLLRLERLRGPTLTRSEIDVTRDRIVLRIEQVLQVPPSNADRARPPQPPDSDSPFTNPTGPHAGRFRRDLKRRFPTPHPGRSSSTPSACGGTPRRRGVGSSRREVAYTGPRSPLEPAMTAAGVDAACSLGLSRDRLASDHALIGHGAGPQEEGRPAVKRVTPLCGLGRGPRAASSPGACRSEGRGRPRSRRGARARTSDSREEAHPRVSGSTTRWTRFVQDGSSRSRGPLP